MASGYCIIYFISCIIINAMQFHSIIMIMRLSENFANPALCKINIEIQVGAFHSLDDSIFLKLEGFAMQMK